MQIVDLSFGPDDDMGGWSGMFLEWGEVGRLEVSNSDTRFHRAPEGWTLVDIEVCVEHSSQIFRYDRTS